MFCSSTIRYKIFQLAVSWYTGEAAQDDEFEGLDGEDDEKDEKEDNEDDNEAAAYALAVLCRVSFVTVGATVCCGILVCFLGGVAAFSTAVFWRGNFVL